jgi:hypothetical protein
MKIEILTSHMGFCEIINKNEIRKYPDCLNVGHYFKAIETKPDKSIIDLVFYSSVTNSKGIDACTFEIIVPFIIQANATFTVEEIETFMQNSYDKASKAFDSYVSKGAFQIVAVKRRL